MKSTLRAKVHLDGSGIASLAAAAFMLRDCDVHGNNITVFEERDTLVGSLDGSGSPHTLLPRLMAYQSMMSRMPPSGCS